MNLSMSLLTIYYAGRLYFYMDGLLRLPVRCLWAQSAIYTQTEYNTADFPTWTHLLISRHKVFQRLQDQFDYKNKTMKHIVRMYQGVRMVVRTWIFHKNSWIFHKILLLAANQYTCNSWCKTSIITSPDLTKRKQPWNTSLRMKSSVLVSIDYYFLIPITFLWRSLIPRILRVWNCSS